MRMIGPCRAFEIDRGQISPRQKRNHDCEKRNRRKWQKTSQLTGKMILLDPGQC